MPVRSKRNIARRSSSDESYDTVHKFAKAAPNLKAYALNKRMMQSSELSNEDDEKNNN